MDILYGLFAASLLLCFTGVSAQAEGDVRLRGVNSNSSQGRVEIFHDNVWGTVCDDNFDNKAAIVVCRQLGFASPSTAQPVVDRRFGAGSGPIWMDDVTCAATETKLSDCQFGNWNNSDCTHDEDVGVICPVNDASPQPTERPSTTQSPIIPGGGNCTQPDPNIRLQGPENNPGVGVVQMFSNGEWGGVCDDNWDANDAKVVCRTLCFDPNNALAGSIAFDTSVITEPMTINNVACVGNEQSLQDCQKSDWQEGICRRTEMAKVTCTPMDNSPPTRPMPILECTNGLLSASFNRTRDPHLDTKHLSVAMDYSGPCNVQFANDTQMITIRIPFDECGTNRTTNDTHIFYHSIIRYLPTFTSGSISNTNTYMVHVTCALERQVLADKPIVPLTEVVTQKSTGNFVVNMHFFKNNSFMTAVTNFPLEVPLGEWLSSALELQDVDENLRLVVPNCYATPTSDKNDPVKYPLFTDKCIDDNTVGFFPINDTWFGYRYQTFKFVQYSEVHIHCEAYICEKEDDSEICDRSCFPSTTTSSTVRRRKRSSSMVATMVQVSSQAIIVYNPAHPPEIERLTTTTKRSTTTRQTTPTTRVTDRVTSPTQANDATKTSSQSNVITEHVTRTTQSNVKQDGASSSQTVHVVTTVRTDDVSAGEDEGVSSANLQDNPYIVGSRASSHTVTLINLVVTLTLTLRIFAIHNL